MDLAFDDGFLDSNDLVALSFVAILLQNSGAINDQAIVFAEIIGLLADAGLDLEEILAEPDSFLVDLFEAL